MNEREKLRVLKSCVLFKGVSEESLSRASVLAETVGFEPGELLFSRDSRRLGIIALGSAKASKPGKNGPVTMSILGYGNVFGAASIIGDDLPETEARAMKKVTALSFAPSDFISLIEDDRRINLNYISYLVSRIRFLTERVECLAGGTAEERLMRYLETNAENGICRISFGMDALAKGISMSRATLYRALEDLEGSGRIVRSGRDIRIL